RQPRFHRHGRDAGLDRPGHGWIARRAATDAGAGLFHGPLLRGDRDHHRLRRRHGEGADVSRQGKAAHCPALTGRQPAAEFAMNHRNAWDLIPWFVNGSIADNERAGLQHHVEGCAACREEIEAQRMLLQTMRTPPQVESMPHGSLQKLWQRIDENPAPAQEEAPVARSPQAFRWLAAAVIVQALLLGVLATVMLRSPRSDADAAYRTVSTAVVEPGPASVRAVFSPDMTLGELQALLERAHLRIVNGPSADGVYTLAT